MIARSDLIILVVSTSALAVGLFRWYTGNEAPRVAAAPPPVVERLADAPSTDSATAAVGNLVRGADDTVAAADSGAVRVRRVADDITGAAGTEFLETEPVVTGRTASTVRTATTTTGTDAPASEALYGRYVVKGGDFLGKLANRFGTSVATLQSINGIDGTTIRVGDELRYPLPAN